MLETLEVLVFLYIPDNQTAMLIYQAIHFFAKNEDYETLI